jgi:hypothetical protein
LNVDKPKGHKESKASLNVQLGWNMNPIGTDATKLLKMSAGISIEEWCKARFLNDT